MAHCRICGQEFDPAAPLLSIYEKNDAQDRRIKRVAGGKICPRCLYGARELAWIKTGKTYRDGNPKYKRVPFNETHLSQHVLYLFERMAKRKARGQSVRWCEANEGRCLEFSTTVIDGHHLCRQHAKPNSTKRVFGSFEITKRYPIVIWAASHEELMEEAGKLASYFEVKAR